MKLALTNSLLSWPVAVTRKTDSAALTVLDKSVMMLHAVTCDICHSNGSTGTLHIKKSFYFVDHVTASIFQTVQSDHHINNTSGFMTCALIVEEV